METDGVTEQPDCGPGYVGKRSKSQSTSPIQKPRSPPERAKTIKQTPHLLHVAGKVPPRIPEAMDYLQWVDLNFDSLAGLASPESSIEDELAIQRVLDNVSSPSSWQGYGNGTDSGSLLLSGLEADVSIDWDLPFLEVNSYTQSTLTPLDWQLIMDLPTHPVVANGFETHLVGAAQQACDPAVSNSVSWPSPSASELSQLIPTPSSEMCEPQRSEKRTRKKRVVQPM